MKIIEHPNPVCRYSLLNIPSCTRYTCILEMTLIRSNKCPFRTKMPLKNVFAYMGSVAVRIFSAFVYFNAFSRPHHHPLSTCELHRFESRAFRGKTQPVISHFAQANGCLSEKHGFNSPFRNKHWHIFASNGRIFPANGCLLPLEISSPLVLQIVLNCNKYSTCEMIFWL